MTSNVHRYNMMMIILLVFASIMVSVSAVGTNDVVLSTPADGAWTNTTNYTTGFTFTWTDYGDALYATANCSLYVSNVTDFLPTLITSTYLQSSVLASRGVETTLYMDTDAFLSNGTTQYWSVKCFNTSSTDGRGTTGWTPTAYTLNQDVTVPQWVILGTSFTNNTWSTTGAVRFEVNLTDSGYDNGGDYTISIVNNSDATQTFGSATTTNASIPFVVPRPRFSTPASISITKASSVPRMRCLMSDLSRVAEGHIHPEPPISTVPATRRLTLSGPCIANFSARSSTLGLSLKNPL